MKKVAAHPFGSALDIEEYRLPNDLTVLVVHEPSAPVIAFQTWLSVGSRHEREGKTGIAHLFEHLMFNETTHVPYGDYDRLLEEVGADNNAATYLDWTYYLVNLPSDALDLVVRLEAERMQHLVLKEEQVESEREVVANERRETVDDDVDGTISELLFATAFEHHSYRFPTIGTMDDIHSLSVSDCRAFYKTHYAPNNATVVVVGDVQTDTLLPLLERHYGDIPASQRPPEDIAKEPEQTGERRKRVELPTETARLVLGYKSPPMSHPDHANLTLLNEVLFGGRGSRLYDLLVEQHELASDASGYVGNFRDPSLMEMFITGNVDVTPTEVLDAIDTAIDDAEPITADEAARASARLELAALSELSTAAGKAESIGFSWVVLGDPAAQLNRLEDYRKATPEELTAALKRYLIRERRTVIEVVGA